MNQQRETAATWPEVITYAKVSATPDGRLTAKHAALYTGLAPGTLANHRSRGTGPKVTRLGRLVFYKLSDLDEWLATGGEA